MCRQLIPKDVAVADESFGLLACSSSQRRISAGEGPGQHRLQRRRDVNDEVRHGDEATEGVDILGARGPLDMNQEIQVGFSTKSAGQVAVALPMTIANTSPIQRIKDGTQYGQYSQLAR